MVGCPRHQAMPASTRNAVPTVKPEAAPLGRRRQSSWNSFCHSVGLLPSRAVRALSSRNGPRTSASMCVRMKQRYASAGVQTIGSPRTLNDVLTTTAHPVAARTPGSGRSSRGWSRASPSGSARSSRCGSRPGCPIAGRSVCRCPRACAARRSAGSADAPAPARRAACTANRHRARNSRRRARAARDGANGRNPSRNLILRFICACIRGLRGSPRMLRAPSARGPNSMRPSNQPTIFSSASRCRHASRAASCSSRRT